MTFNTRKPIAIETITLLLVRDSQTSSLTTLLDYWCAHELISNLFGFNQLSFVQQNHHGDVLLCTLVENLQQGGFKVVSCEQGIRQFAKDYPEDLHA